MKYLLIVLLFSMSIILAQSADMPSGNGTEASPYQIETIDNLYWITQDNSRLSLYYIQTQNVDASGTAAWFSGSGWTPIGSSSNPFTGSYNGQGFTISGLTISRTSSSYIGLFGYTSGATISNLNLISTDFKGSSYVAALVGYNNTSRITGCSSSGTIISYSSSCGGLVGENASNSTVNKSQSSCSVYGGYYTGGLIGKNQSSALTSQCYTSGNVYSGLDYAGGLIGLNYGNINNCYSTCDVTRSGTGNSTNFAGFLGKNDGGTVDDCFCTGNTVISVTDKGFCGSNSGEGTIQNCFWDTQTSDQITSNGGDGKTTLEMKTHSTFTDAGWNINIWNIDDDVNDGYPYLDWQNTTGSPLPVDLTSFTATFAGNVVILAWQTATEINNYGFSIERAIKNAEFIIDNWEEIAFIEGHGNSNSPKSYEYIDNLDPNLSLEYRLKQIDTDGGYKYYNTTVKVDIQITDVNNTEKLPTEFALEQNYPNPFNPTTTIKYSIPVVATFSKTSLHTTLIVYDMLGREVATLVNKQQASGNYSVNFDASKLTSGMYIYKINAGNFVQSHKMMLIK